MPPCAAKIPKTDDTLLKNAVKNMSVFPRTASVGQLSNETSKISRAIFGETRCYRLFGYSVELPFLLPFTVSDPKPNVIFAFVNSRLRPTGLATCRSNRSATAAILTNEKGHRYLIAENGQIRSTNLGGETDQYRFFAIKVVMTVFMTLRKELLFHASAFEFENKAFIILGDCGLGKSTTVAFLELKGLRVLADDVVRVAVNEEGASVVCSGMGKVLTEAAAAHLSPGGEFLKQMGLTSKLWFPQVETSGEKETVPLGGIFRLCKEASTHADLQTATERVFQLMRGLVMPQLLVRTDAEGLLKQLRGIAATSFLHSMQAGRCLHALPELASEMLERAYRNKQIAIAKRQES